MARLVDDLIIGLPPEEGVKARAGRLVVEVFRGPGVVAPEKPSCRRGIDVEGAGGAGGVRAAGLTVRLLRAVGRVIPLAGQTHVEPNLEDDAIAVGLVIKAVHRQLLVVLAGGGVFYV